MKIPRKDLHLIFVSDQMQKGALIAKEDQEAMRTWGGDIDSYEPESKRSSDPNDMSISELAAVQPLD